MSETETCTKCKVCGWEDFGTQPARCRKCRSRKVQYLAKPSKFVVVQHLTMPDRGICFFTTNSERGRDCYGNTGELWDKNVAFADNVQEAQVLIDKLTTYPTSAEVYKHFNINF